jgi:hypothetical protein
VAQPTQLTPTEQDALVKQIGLAMLRVAPEDWEQLTVDYRAVGRYAESTGQVTFTDGSAEPWEMPADLRGLFARLRAGMYREGRGTWFNARYKLDHPSSYNLEYDREEPGWDVPPPPQAYPDDMRMFPRTDENVPEWLRRRLAAAPPPPPPPSAPPPGPGGPPPNQRFRVARIFDGPGEDGRPSVNRPPVDEMDIQELLDYLDGAPLVGPARGYDVDRLDQSGKQSVPVAFHTDGTWIWPAAVNYYLREHDISPETDLVEHIRRMRFKLVPVDEQTRVAAQQFLGPPPPGPGPVPGPRPGPPAPAPTRAMPVPAPPPVPAGGPPRAALPSQGPASQQIDQLRARLDDLDVPDTAYRIGQPTGRGWVMEQTDEGWRVGWHDRDWVAPAMFEDVGDASAFLLGKLLLDTDRWAAGPKNPELQASQEEAGFTPMSAPIEAFEPMAAPAEAYDQGRPGGPVKPPPGTPGYSDRFTEPSDGFAPPRPGPPPGTPPRPAPTMAMEPPALDPPARGMDAPAHGRDTAAHSLDDGDRGYEQPGHVDPPGRGLFESSSSPGRGSDGPSHGLDSPSRGFEAPGFGGGFDAPGQGFDPPGGGFDAPGRANGFDAPGRGDSSSGYGVDPAGPPGRGGEPGRGFDAPGRTDSPAHGLDAAGFDSPGRGFDSSSSGQGFDSPGRGAAAGRGLRDDSVHGLDSPGRGFETARTPDSPDFDPPERAVAPSHGFDAGRRDEPAHGLDSPGRGFEAPRVPDSPDFDAPERAAEPGRGLDTPGRGLDSRGLDSGGRGLDSGGRGLDSPPRGVELPARGGDATVLASRPMNGAATAPAGSEWPISPLPGEPPLTLFRGKRVIELEPGMEIDRYGDGDGNLVYAAGTPFSERSLVPDWIDRPYHVYRVRQPVQALTGAAIPWFDQPGGGTAFLLPDAVSELVAHGHLVEVSDRERPPG